MIKGIRSKLNNCSGETLAETLIAVLISALALVLLFSMITASSRLIRNGEEKIDEMYDGSKKIEQKTADVKPNVTVIIEDKDSLSIPHFKMEVKVNVYTDDESSLTSYECAD
ncbi:MAG: hypothetical protein Q4C14_08985 [Bacillota bacterium]|nr:hypothetical protein [Bacillota bacterium]